MLMDLILVWPCVQVSVCINVQASKKSKQQTQKKLLIRLKITIKQQQQPHRANSKYFLCPVYNIQLHTIELDAYAWTY